MLLSGWCFYRTRIFIRVIKSEPKVCLTPIINKGVRGICLEVVNSLTKQSLNQKG